MFLSCLKEVMSKDIALLLKQNHPEFPENKIFFFELNSVPIPIFNSYWRKKALSIKLEASTMIKSFKLG